MVPHPLDRRIDFEAGGDARFPYQATVDGHCWQLRVDAPERPTVYTLLIDGEAVALVPEWPAGWRSPAPPPTEPFSVAALVARNKAQNAADLAAAEREAGSTGKEPFSYARLATLFGRRLPDLEEILRQDYYVCHPEMLTLTEYTAHLRLMDLWA